MKIKVDEEELKKAVATVGPITVGIDCEDDMFNYDSGKYLIIMICFSTEKVGQSDYDDLFFYKKVVLRRIYNPFYLKNNGI